MTCSDNSSGDIAVALYVEGGMWLPSVGSNFLAQTSAEWTLGAIELPDEYP